MSASTIVSRNLTRIGLVMTTECAINRGLARGIAHYAQPPRQWILQNVVEIACLPRNPAATQNELDALIVGNIHRDTDQWVEWIRKSGLPCITIKLDFASLAQLAVEHYRARGRRRVGYVAWGAPTDEQTRFEAAAQARCLAYISFARMPGERTDVSPEEDREALDQFLRAVPKPIGLLAATSRRARQVMDRCRILGIGVPDEVAVMGVEDEPTEISLAYPALSCICLASEQAGYRAAEVMDIHLRTGRAPVRSIPLRATRILTRQSTDAWSIDDPDVREAILYIAAKATHRLKSAEVVEQSGVGRRALERRFRMLLGRSILDEIQRVRVEHAKKLLAETDFKLATIALECGYAESKRLGATFRRIVGCTPGEWRRNLASTTDVL